jgi:hypothetical protein
MTGNDKTGTETPGAISVFEIMERITVLFERLRDLEGKLRRYGAGDGDAGLIPNLLTTQLKALRLCAAISKEVHEAEELLRRRR